MIQQLIDSIKIQKKDMLSCFAGILGFGLFGTLIISIIFWTDETATSWFCMGAIMALLAMFGIIILSFLSYHQEFMIALSMGQTRRGFMITFALRQFLWVLAAYISILLFYQLEQLYYKAAFPEMKQAFALSFLTDLRIVVAVIPGLAALTMFLGALYSRFCKKFSAGLYILWIGFCLVIPKFINQRDEYSGPVNEGIGMIGAYIFAVPPIVWMAVGICAIIVMAVTIIHLGMKQMVR